MSFYLSGECLPGQHVRLTDNILPSLVDAQHHQKRVVSVLALITRGMYSPFCVLHRSGRNSPLFWAASDCRLPFSFPILLSRLKEWHNTFQPGCCFFDFTQSMTIKPSLKWIPSNLKIMHHPSRISSTMASLAIKWILSIFSDTQGYFTDNYCHIHGFRNIRITGASTRSRFNVARDQCLSF